LAKARYLILSDIHSNLEALEAVFRTVQRRRYDGVLCMGDLVGYGASPNPVVTRLRRLKHPIFVRGNHDKVCCGIEDGSNFNAAAKFSSQWTQKKLSQENRRFLAILPQGPREVMPGVLIAHGSLPDEDSYLFSDFDAYQSFEAMPFRVCFFGHTHFPAVFVQDDAGIEFWQIRGETSEIELKPGSRYLINPGSVGQPRDRNPGAAFAEYYPESQRVVVRRVPYDISSAAARIRKAGLPENLANRLRVGT
jgi:diadenosine tetraphosphatase ApaH/serine/threonine PP2A family protein phosphatase